MLPSALDTFSFYFNYDYGRRDDSTPGVNDNEAYVKHIVDSFYKLNFGKIVKVYDMVSECGRFFIITFNKETFNWSNKRATTIYSTGFPTDTWGCKHITTNSEPITLENEKGQTWEIYMTSFPDIDEKPEFIGEWTYNIIWTINDFNEEQDSFEIERLETDKSIDDTIHNSIYCIDDNNNLSCRCGGCPDLTSDDDILNEIASIDSDSNKWRKWGGDNNWVECIIDDNDTIEWMTKEKKEQQFYENWAAELDELSVKYCGNNWIENNVWTPIRYRYDLSDISYNSYDDVGYKTENGYTAYTKLEFIDYYGEEEGKMRWNSDIYSAPCTTEGDPFVHDPPHGCMFKYNISYLLMKLCVVYNDEDEFNIGRTILRKYVDILWSYTDPTDDEREQKPVINLRADYNNNIFNLSCWYNFKYTNLRGFKLNDVEKLIMNIKSHFHHNDIMIEWVPSSE